MKIAVFGTGDVNMAKRGVGKRHGKAGGIVMKCILVAGGAGFLGAHLCERLLKEENRVICVDNLFTGSKKNIGRLLTNPYFKFIRHDVTEPLYEEVDQIYNLAAAGR